MLSVAEISSWLVKRHNIHVIKAYSYGADIIDICMYSEHSLIHHNLFSKNMVD